MECIEEKEKSIPDLLGLLSHKDLDIRWRAATALGRAGALAVEPLIRKLFDDDQNVRILAIWALGKIGDARAIGPISRAANCDRGPVLLAAEGALSRMKQ